MNRHRQHALAHGTPEGQAYLGGTQLNRDQDMVDSLAMLDAELQRKRNGPYRAYRNAERAFRGLSLADNMS